MLLPQDVLQSEGYNACLQLLKKVHDQQKEPELTKILSETLKMRLPEKKQLAIGTTLAEVPAKTSDRASEEHMEHIDERMQHILRRVLDARRLYVRDPEYAKTAETIDKELQTVMKMLMSEGTQPQGLSALIDWCCRFHDGDLARMALEAGAEPNYPRHHRTAPPPLYTAIENSAAGVAKALIDFSADPNSTVLFRPAEDSFMSIFCQKECAATPLHYALTFANPNTDVVKLLITAGANLDFVGSWDGKRRSAEQVPRDPTTLPAPLSPHSQRRNFSLRLRFSTSVSNAIQSRLRPTFGGRVSRRWSTPRSEPSEGAGEHRGI